MGYIHAIQTPDNTTHLIEPLLYSAAGGTSGALTATITNFVLVTGVTIALGITTTNTANATLSINNGDAKAIYYKGLAITANILKADYIYHLVYDGNVWHVIGNITNNADTAIAAASTANATQYGVTYYSDANGTFASTAAGGSGLVFIGNGSAAAPSWYSGLNLTSTTTNNVTSHEAEFLGTVNIAGNTNIGSSSTASTLAVWGKLGVGANADNTYPLYINGNSLFNGDLIPTLSNDSTPVPDKTLGSSTNAWAAVYIGDGDHGDAYTPVYWHNGVPTTVNTIQRESFSISPTSAGVAATVDVLINNTNVTDDTQITTIVVDSGESYLNSIIEWTIDTTNNVKKIKLTATVTNTVSGYILFKK